jgi:RNA polymerase sigma-70 factor (ECF subfamily)
MNSLTLVRESAISDGAMSDDDRHALVSSLYAEHGVMLHTYVNRLVRDPHHAEDVVQETMVRAWRNAEALRPCRSSMTGWLKRVARNVVVDRVRARNARPEEVEESYAAPWSADHAATVVNSMFVAEALSHLSPAHRQVLEVVYFADRTTAQAAELLGLPVGTVKSRVYYALRHLRLYVAEFSADLDPLQ